MKCPYCEENVWRVQFCPDVNIIQFWCNNCACTIEIPHKYDELTPED